MAEDRDAAAYLLNDFYNLLDEKQVYFFPSSYKRSAAYGAEDAQGVVQRTAAMNAVRGFTKDTWWSAPILRRWPNGSSTPRPCSATRLP